MGRPSLGPRLYLSTRVGRPSIWMIRHGEYRASTGYYEHERAQAEWALVQYVSEGRKGRKKAPKKPERGTIYIMTVEAEDRPVKIGFTDHLGRRQSHMQTGMPFLLRLEAAFFAESAIEGLLHSILSRHRIRGEWFRRCPDVEMLIEHAKRDDVDGYLMKVKAAANDTARGRNKGPVRQKSEEANPLS